MKRSIDLFSVNSKNIFLICFRPFQMSQIDLKSLLIDMKADHHVFMYFGQGFDRSSEKPTFDYFNEELKKMDEADENYALYKSCLAFCYYYGFGTMMDYKMSFQLYEFAAKKGLVNAQSDLAYQYLNGEGVEKNVNEAFKWFVESSKNGNTDSQYRILTMKENELNLGFNDQTLHNLEFYIEWYERYFQTIPLPPISQFEMAQIFLRQLIDIYMNGNQFTEKNLMKSLIYCQKLRTEEQLIYQEKILNSFQDEVVKRLFQAQKLEKYFLLKKIRHKLFDIDSLLDMIDQY